VTDANLKLRGYTGSAWEDTGVQPDSPASVTGNAFTVLVPDGSQACSVYAIAYPIAGQVGVATATPMLFKSTRSFNPNNPNTAFRKAHFYYSSAVPKDVEVKIYDASGTLIKSLGLNAGVDPNDVTTDPISGNSSYFFSWDGHNDNGDTVKNGLYLVRWKVTHVDGSVDTQVKPVALIK
jgi:hypothetical protein